jgi:hypothetical protein
MVRARWPGAENEELEVRGDDTNCPRKFNSSTCFIFRNNRFTGVMTGNIFQIKSNLFSCEWLTQSGRRGRENEEGLLTSLVQHPISEKITAAVVEPNLGEVLGD